MITPDMPIWFKTIQVIGWSEIAILFALLPFERKYTLIERAERLLPRNTFWILSVALIIATPIIWAGLLACLMFIVYFFILWLLTKDL